MSQPQTQPIYSGCAQIGVITERDCARWEAVMSDGFPLGLFNRPEGAAEAIWCEYHRRRNGA